MNEAEAAVRNQMKNQAGTDVFAHSAKIAAYNKLMGISVASAYRQPGTFKNKKDETKAKSPVPQPVTVSGENVDLTMFNG